MATVLEQCPSIVRFGYHFTQQGPRARAAQAMTRNNELREYLQTWCVGEKARSCRSWWMPLKAPRVLPKCHSQKLKCHR